MAQSIADNPKLLHKMSCRLKNQLNITSKGVGFIEVMTATVIISISCIGLLMGIVHAEELHALEVKERATEELLNYGILERKNCRW